MKNGFLDSNLQEESNKAKPLISPIQGESRKDLSVLEDDLWPQVDTKFLVRKI